MSTHPFRLTPLHSRPKFSPRWILVLAATLILHLLALEWVNGHLRTPFARDEQEDVVATVELKPEPSSAPASKQLVKLHPKVVHEPKEKAQLPPPPRSETIADSTATEPTPETPSTSNAPASLNSTASQQLQADAAISTKTDTPADKATAMRYKVSLPPPVLLHYDLKEVSPDGGTIGGSGSISWKSANGLYKLSLRANKYLLIQLLASESEGTVDEYGIAPTLYSQKAINRSQTNTHFNRDERNSITFSATTNSYPIKGGEQDRASIPWQLAGIARGDNGHFLPGAQFEIFVVGDRDGETWTINVVGQEEIETGLGKIPAWHVVRNPRPNTYDKKTDIWLAPQFEWYPVKVRNTEKSGKYVDMVLSSLPQNQVADTSPDALH